MYVTTISVFILLTWLEITPQKNKADLKLPSQRTRTTNKTPNVECWKRNCSRRLEVWSTTSPNHRITYPHPPTRSPWNHLFYPLSFSVCLGNRFSELLIQVSLNHQVLFASQRVLCSISKHLYMWYVINMSNPTFPIHALKGSSQPRKSVPGCPDLLVNHYTLHTYLPNHSHNNSFRVRIRYRILLHIMQTWVSGLDRVIKVTRDK